MNNDVLLLFNIGLKGDLISCSILPLLLLKNKYGKTPVKHLADLGMFECKTDAAHCVHVSSEDIEILRNYKVNVLNNPTSNLKLGNGFAPISEFLDRGLNVSLGTDGPASNNNVNLFEEKMCSFITQFF